MRVLRRLWWATLPFEGWTGGFGPGDGRPCPWWAHPIAWINRTLDDVVFAHRSPFGPRFEAWTYRPVVGAKKPRPWQ